MKLSSAVCFFAEPEASLPLPLDFDLPLFPLDVFEMGSLLSEILGEES